MGNYSINYIVAHKSNQNNKQAKQLNNEKEIIRMGTISLNQRVCVCCVCACVRVQYQSINMCVYVAVVCVCAYVRALAFVRANVCVV